MAVLWQVVVGVVGLWVCPAEALPAWDGRAVHGPLWCDAPHVLTFDRSCWWPFV